MRGGRLRHNPGMPANLYTLVPAVLQQHPGYSRGVVWVTDATNSASPPALVALLREAEEGVRARVTGNPAEHPRIAAWREAYRRFGAKPSEHRSAIEALTRRVLKPDTLPSINALVDIGTIVSLRHLLPAGVHPVVARPHDLALRLAVAGDVFLPPDGSAAEAPPAGEIVFASGSEVLTRRWTWRQAAGTQTTEASRAVFFNVDGLPPCTRAEVEAAMADVTTLVAAHCGGTVRTALLDAAQPAASF